MVSITPPHIDNLKIEDFLNLGKFGLKFRNLDKRDAYRLLRWAPMPIADLVAEWFENELLRATIAARGIFASFAGPWSAGTSVGLLMGSTLGSDGIAIQGGPGALTQSLARAASASGAEIRTNAAVRHIYLKKGEASSVVLESGEEIPAIAIVSNADPRQTFLKLVDATDLEPGFLGKVRAYRAAGCVAKVNLALSGLPNFSAIKNGSADLSGRIHIGPDIDYLERAFDAAKYGEFSPSPYLDITIPSVSDSTLAPSGAHVMSIHVQYAPYRLKDRDWNACRSELGEAVVKTVEDYAPNIRDLILHRQVITPLDLEQVCGLSGGHLYHGEHALDQMFAFRPLLGWAQYRTPIKGLYLCGSGTHPGGGITGAPGANASREVIKDLKQR
jgi:phytoene dehydrogenase-like protein